MLGQTELQMFKSIRWMAFFVFVFSCLPCFALASAQESGAVVLKLIAEQKFADAQQWIDNQLRQHPDSINLVALQVRLGIAIAQVERNSNRGAQLIQSKLPTLVENPKLSHLHALVAAQGLHELLRIEQLAGAVSPKDELSQNLLIRLRTLSLNEPSPAYETVLRTIIERLVWLDRFEEAKTVLKEERQALDSGDLASPSFRSRLASLAMIAGQNMIRVFPEYIEQLTDETNRALTAAEPSSSEFATFLRFQRAAILAMAMNSSPKARPQLAQMMSAAEHYRAKLSEEERDNFKRMTVLLTRAITKSEEGQKLKGSKDTGVRFTKIVDFRLKSDPRASTETNAMRAIAKERFLVVYFWTANSEEDLRQLRLLHRWYQEMDHAKVQLVAATQLGNFQWSESLQHAIVAKTGSVSQEDQIKMLESIQEKLGLGYPMATMDSAVSRDSKTGLIVLAPQGNVVEVLQMEPQSLRTINSIVGK
jgi:hypothetical protein